jgi:cobalt-zinc-cadmium efflux system membrane fusion protein
MNKQPTFKLTRPIIGGLAAITVGLMQLALTPAVSAQDDDHAGHDHGAKPSMQEQAHDDHGHEEGGHGGHDEHGEEAVRFDAATLEEFGIVIQEAGPGAIGETIRLPGEVVFNADRVAHVTPSVTGIVRQVNQSVGDRVEAGEVMAVLTSRELAAARSEYLGAKARLELERETLEREERLVEDRIGTQRDLLEARKAVREEEIALNLAEQNLHALGQTQAEVDALDESTEMNLNEYELRAPFGGLVIAREATQGEVVSEEPEEPPFIVAEVSSVWVNLSVYQRDLTSVKPGMDVRIDFGHGIPSASGKISFVSPSLDEETRTATARIVLDNEQGQWRPGLFVTGRVTSGEESVAVVVPETALQEVEGQTAVFIQDEDGFELRQVVVGRRGKDTVEIVEGLEAGQRFVSQNGFAIKAEMEKGSFGDGHNH